MESKGILIIISGFSGAGKGTIVKELMREDNFALSISSTTRKARSNEIHGENYYFIQREEFEQLIEEGEFIEWAQYCDNYYGTPKSYVDQQLNDGKDIILEIEMQGALQVKEKFPDALLVFITAPSAQTIKNRLITRGTETEEQILQRLKKSYREIDAIDNYNFIVVNDGLDESVLAIKNIIINEHHRVIRNKNIKQKMKREFEELLKGDL